MAEENKPVSGGEFLLGFVMFLLFVGSVMFLAKNVADRIKSLEEKVDKLESINTKEKE